MLRHIFKEHGGSLGTTGLRVRVRAFSLSLSLSLSLCVCVCVHWQGQRRASLSAIVLCHVPSPACVCAHVRTVDAHQIHVRTHTRKMAACSQSCAPAAQWKSAGRGVEGL